MGAGAYFSNSDPIPEVFHQVKVFFDAKICFNLCISTEDGIFFLHFGRRVPSSLLFLAATKQLYEWFSPSVRLSVRPSVRLSVRLSHLFDYVPIILSS